MRKPRSAGRRLPVTTLRWDYETSSFVDEEFEFGAELSAVYEDDGEPDCIADNPESVFVSELDKYRRRVREAAGFYRVPDYSRTCTCCRNEVVPGSKDFTHPISRALICYDCLVLLTDLKDTIDEFRGEDVASQ
jgi:hypothetical protein